MHDRPFPQKGATYYILFNKDNGHSISQRVEISTDNSSTGYFCLLDLGRIASSVVKILVTGGSGFIGNYLIEHLKQLHPTATILSVSSRKNTNPAIAHTFCELTDPDGVRSVVQGFQPDFVYHLVGCARISAELQFQDYFEGNFLPTQNLLNALKETRGPVSLFLTSSMHVYGRTEAIVTEASLVHPDSPYAFTKYLAEEAVRDLVRKKENFRGVIGRLYTCFGPGQSEGFVAADLCKKLHSLPNVPGSVLKTGGLGSHRRFLDVRDAVKIFPLVLERPLPSRFEIFNISSEYDLKIGDLLEILIKISGKHPKVESTPDNSNVFMGTQLDLKKLHEFIQPNHFRPVEETLKDLWESQNQGD